MASIAHTRGAFVDEDVRLARVVDGVAGLWLGRKGGLERGGTGMRGDAQAGSLRDAVVRDEFTDGVGGGVRDGEHGCS
jgi:hypothetical protein